MISVLLPTIRPDLAHAAMSSIEAAAGSVSYEVVVVADFEQKDLGGLSPCRNIEWHVRPREGVIAAIAEAERQASGTHLFVFNDESRLAQGALSVLFQRALAEPRRLLGPRHVPDFPFRYYGLPFVAFPFAHRSLYAELGGLFDTAYRGFYADPDLSMRAHAAGIPVEVVEEAVIVHGNDMGAHGHPEAVAQYLEADRALFRSRWDHLGQFGDPS